MTTGHDYRCTIERGHKKHTLELTNYSDDDAHKAMARWLLDIGYKPPRFFGLIVDEEIRVSRKKFSV